MEKPIIITIIIAIMFFFAKLIEMKYIEKESKPMKFIIRDTMLVLVCAFIPITIFFQASGPMAEMLGTNEFASSIPTQIFTDGPGF